MSILKIKLDQDLKADSTYVMANVYSLKKEKDQSVPSIEYRNIIIPVISGKTNHYLDGHMLGGQPPVDVPPGRYLVQAVLPSGDSVEKDITVEESDREMEVHLHGHKPSRDWLALQSFQRGEDFFKMRSISIDESLPPPPPDRGPSAWPAIQLYTCPSPVISWRYIFDLVKSEPRRASRLLQDFPRLIRGGKIVTGFTDTEADPSITINHFASPGEVPLTYSSNRYIDYPQGIPRFLAGIAGEDGSTEIASLPVPWVQTFSDNEAIVDLVTTDYKGETEGSPVTMHRVEVTVQDSFITSVLGYLSSGDARNARSLIDPARDLLVEKVHNPLSAAAGAYILLSDIKEGAIVENAEWFRWVSNLCEWFRWMPDGAILSGWLELRKGHEKDARKRFLEAMDRGLPYYSMGIGWLLDGLSFISENMELSNEKEKVIDDALDVVRFVARHTDMSQPFTKIKIGVMKPR